MTETSILEQKIKQLEERLKKLEDIVFSPELITEKNIMDKLYEKAKELVIKYNKVSVIFLQKKLIIDYVRAKRLINELEKNGVISPASPDNTRQVLTK
jgi:DNA segregation ATPase FtsK/SpoIIIE-like protein